jgi:hypothetical protein
MPSIAGVDCGERRTHREAHAWLPLDRAGEWIVQLYQNWGKPEKAVEWTQKLGAAKSPATSVRH